MKLDRDIRPSPEALLKQAAREGGRGLLKIFLGAAPGVGKTYAMLEAARARRCEGIDLVAAVVETHGRAETQALLDGLELLPPRRVEYRDHVLEEMDLDGVIARKPTLALVDELAHSNAPGSRHPKRYLDVGELLAAGIDVYTTLNIQHVESLNDVVAQITRIRVRETVPDSIVDRADAIELVDLTPDDLLQRLREGKVYLAHTAARAVGNYFTAGNLTALRELALRRTAQRVDAQLLDHMQTHAIAGPWAAGERILVCVTRSSAGPGLVRAARRMADQLRAPWTAAYVETPAHLRMADADRNRITDTLMLAERLGAETMMLPGQNVAATILEYARTENVTQLVVGSPGRLRRRGWSAVLPWRRSSVASELVAIAGDLPVYLVSGGERDAPPAPAIRPRFTLDGRSYALTTLVVGLAILAGMALREVLAVSSISLVFLTAVLASAALWGLYPSLYACVLSMMAYNFFFLPPLYTFSIADPENVVALFFFLVAAVVASHLAGGVRSQALAASQRARTTEELYKFSRKLAAITELDDLLWAAAYQIAAMLKLRVVLLLPTKEASERVEVRAGYPPEDALDEADLAAAKWCWQRHQPAGRGADTLPGARRLFLPWSTGRGPLGVIGIDSDRPGPLLTPDQRRLLAALSDQAAVSLERMELAEGADRARLLAETERLQSALLTSISHDLRTPLASILGAASSLETYKAELDGAASAELLGTIREEAERLNRFVANLLDMTRLESGALELRREDIDLGEAIGSALARAGKVLADHLVELRIDADLPPLSLDAVLFEQVLFNLLDNAAKYAPGGSTVTFQGRNAEDAVVLDVMDEGVGVPPDALSHLFDKFYRVRGADRQRAGTGLGLAVCRGFVEAMGGSIVAANRTDRPGAVFTLTLPVAPPRVGSSA